MWHAYLIVEGILLFIALVAALAMSAHIGAWRKMP